VIVAAYPDHLAEPATVMAGNVALPGILTLPPAPQGVVLFAHGSGSSRLSRRNRFVADALHVRNFGTLLFDLLTEDEERDRSNVFDVELLSTRLRGATDWVAARPACAGLPLGYFGASTGAAAALVAAAAPTGRVDAVVSRGGRPDLAGAYLPLVRVPTLLIVGGADTPVLALNREAYEQLGGTKRLVVIPDATHLFEEPGTLEAVAHHAAEWFGQHLGAGREHEAAPAGAGGRAH
jgi:pimeloyl-ACP methyl ester carboxylesterase